MNFQELMNTSEYDFLREDLRLGKRIILLGVSGSHGYGTNREGSDVDFRGIALNRPSDILGAVHQVKKQSKSLKNLFYVVRISIKGTAL